MCFEAALAAPRIEPLVALVTRPAAVSLRQLDLLPTFFSDQLDVLSESLAVQQDPIHSKLP